MITSIVKGAFSWSVGDKPTVTVSFQDDDGAVLGSAELAFGTFRTLDSIGSPLEAEGLLTLTTTEGTFDFASAFTIFSRGFAYFRAALLTPGGFTLNGAISAAVGITATITILSGTIPATGFARINNEVVSFTRVTSTNVTLDRRGLFNTAAAAHGDADVVKFAACLETGIPQYEYTIDSDDPIDKQRSDIFSRKGVGNR